MSYQFSNVETSGRTKYFPLEITRVSRSQTGGIEPTEQFSRFVFLTTYNESFEATWTVNDSNFGAVNKTFRYSQTNRKLTLSFKLPARNVADSKENLDFCQKLARLAYGKYYTSLDGTSVTEFNRPVYNYQGALFDIRFNFGNLIRNENVYITEFSFTPNFDAGIFEYSATPVTTENGTEPLGRLKDRLFSEGSSDLPETSYTSHGDLGKVYPKEVEVNIGMIILHDYPLGFGGPRREGEPLKWAENSNRDWPHGTGPTYPVLEYMTEDEEALPELIVTPEDPEAEQDQPVEPQTTIRPRAELTSEDVRAGRAAREQEPVQWTVDEYGNIQVLNY
jgi:hypothetical protein